nr:hypothetical protein CPGR_00195 [Mycolicibacter nonchromogenicus]
MDVVGVALAEVVENAPAQGIEFGAEGIEVNRQVRALVRLVQLLRLLDSGVLEN